MDSDSFEDLYKIVILGDTDVGKTTFLSSWIYGSPRCATSNQYSDFESKTLELKSGKKVKVQVWDVSGEEEFRDLASLYCKGASAAFVMFDLTKESSFRSVKSWIQEVEILIGKSVLLVGNKVDICIKNPMLRKVQPGKVQEIAQLYKVTYAEISAQNVKTTQEMFMDLVEKIDTIAHPPEPMRKLNWCIFLLLFVIGAALIRFFAGGNYYL